jgi:predicted ATP-grasp superfamily ATP-dependent carboligase
VPTLVVAALSARLLAQSARRAGWTVVALDLFGDIDTRAAADEWHPIGDPAALRVDRDLLLAALEDARKHADCVGWVAGAGFEPHHDLLETGARVLPLLGNDRATLDRVRDPRAFFAALDELGVPHPQTRFDAPDEAGGWLVKDFASSGGWHVRPASTAHESNCGGGIHFQRLGSGRALSVLFVAAGERVVSLGFNEMLVRAHGTRPYAYRGVVGPVRDVAPEVAHDLASVLDNLVRRFALRGLGSLDFLLDDDKFAVLEVNPRPPASMALYETAAADGLLKWHVDACKGRLPAAPIETILPRGELIVYADRELVVTCEDVQRLIALGCRDLPQPQSHVAVGAPLCSVSALGDSPRVVRELLAQREAAVLSVVQNRCETHKDENHQTGTHKNEIHHAG